MKDLRGLCLSKAGAKTRVCFDKLRALMCWMFHPKRPEKKHQEA
jgi:hypothetical protein